MRFFLMQRNHPVAVIEIAEKTGDIIDVAEVLSAQRIPLGAKHSDGSFDVLSLRKWWAGRGIAGFVFPLQYLRRLFTKALAHCGRKTNPLKSRIGHLQAGALQRNRCHGSV